MVRIAIESEYQTCKMADRWPENAIKKFQKNKKLCIDLTLPAIEGELRTSKMADGSHYVKN